MGFADGVGAFLLWLAALAMLSIAKTTPPMGGVELAAIPIGFAGAWVYVAACRWFCRNLTFSDGSTAEFSGKASQILGWWALLILVGWPRWHEFLDYPAVLGAVFWLAGMLASLGLLRWFVKHVELSSGSQLHFTGGLGEYIGWEVLLGLSVLTIIGWAWILAAMYRWMARHTESETRALRFHGEGPQILWRTLATLLFCIPVVTIPWAFLWYTRWLVGNTTIEGQLDDLFGV
jgi:uncharacterized membrane protein YjgN (DUF898 family)